MCHYPHKLTSIILILSAFYGPSSEACNKLYFYHGLKRQMMCGILCLNPLSDNQKWDTKVVENKIQARLMSI